MRKRLPAGVELRRRKGIRDTLLDADGVPLAGGEGALAPFLAGANRTFFERMFSLDHERLRRSGQAILDAGDEAGQVLFTSVAGIEGLRATRQTLADEADGLWGKRRTTPHSITAPCPRPKPRCKTTPGLLNIPGVGWGRLPRAR